MKVLVITLLALVSFKAFSQLTPKREPIYHCIFQGNMDTQIDAVFVVSSRFGSNQFYEIRVDTFLGGVDKTTYKKVNLVETYGGRVATYGTGNTRVKIDHVFPVEGKFKSFVRIADHGMHSNDWLCKSLID